jgi:ATP-dependent exoDNAse (exonuclease V) alpha subunit
MTQDQALAIMKTGVNIYLTGSAGSGKTYLLNQYIAYLKEHDIPVAVTASTGIAATHMNGMTIHGWSGIGIREHLDEHEIELLEGKQYLWKRFDKARVLIIDEVSMLHAHRLDMIERICRRFKRNALPFGGLQVILSGDFFQLPPITRRKPKDNIPEENLSQDPGDVESDETKDMVIHSEAWRIMKPAICYLTEQHRQEDETLTEILNRIRDNSIDDMHYEHLAKRINAELPEGIRPTKLYTHNANVDNENMLELNSLESGEKIYKMTTIGPLPLVEVLKKSCLAHEELRLKVGAEVMCIKNNFEEGYVNGTRGKVVSFLDDGGVSAQANTPVIELYNGKTIYATPETWAIEEDGKTKASIKQLPIRLAWAITIHKSQGMSLDHAEIDLSRTFAYGMGYVALSRVRTLEGIRLVGFNPSALRVDPKVLAFDQDLRKESTQNELMFGKLKANEQKKLEEVFIQKMGGSLVAGKVSSVVQVKIPTLMVTKELLEKGKSIKDISKERDLTPGTITHHIEQIIEQYPETDISHIKPKQKYIDLVKKANDTLEGEEVGKLNPIKSILEKEGHNLSFEDIRLARLFI